MSWTDGVTTAARRDTNVTANKSVTASFAINSYTLTYTAGSHGAIQGSRSQTVDYGSSGTAVTAVADTGYHFVSWSDGVTSATRTDTNVTANKSVTASFVINTYTLTYKAGTGGAISGTSPQAVNHGGSGTPVTAVAAVGYHFMNWSDGLTTATRTDASITDDKTVTAIFAINTYTLTYSAGAHGTIQGTTPQSVNHGSSGSVITATPDTGYHFVSWSDGVTTATRQDTNVTGEKSVTASFAINTYTLSYTAGPHGAISGVTPQRVDHGDSGTAVTAVPEVGYHFLKWSDGVAEATRTDAATATLDVTAVFAIDVCKVSYTAGTGGTIVGISPQLVDYGSDGTTVTAAPDAGYHFVRWSDGVLTAERRDTGVVESADVTAYFEISTEVRLLAPSTCAYGSVTLAASLASTDGVPVEGRNLVLERSADATHWSPVRAFVSGVSTVSVTATPTVVSYYRVVFSGDTTYSAAASRVVKVKPRANISNVGSPWSMSRTRSYAAYGYLRPRHTSGSYPVRIYKYRYVSGKWRAYGYVNARAYNYGTFTKYSVSLRLPYAGRWRLRALALGDVGHVATWSSGYRYVKVY